MLRTTVDKINKLFKCCVTNNGMSVQTLIYELYIERKLSLEKFYTFLR
jgi:hypothetical protein